MQRLPRISASLGLLTGRRELGETARRLLLRRAKSSTPALERLLPTHDDFCSRHLGPRTKDQKAMLDYLGLKVSSMTRFSCTDFCSSCSEYTSAVSADARLAWRLLEL